MRGNSLLLKSFAVFIFCSSSVLAVLEHDEDDLKLSKTKSLMTGISGEELKKNSKGVMTLCFNKDEPSLVLETFLPKSPTEISLNMIYCGTEDCYGGKKEIKIDGSVGTIKKAYRGVDRKVTTGEFNYVPPLYKKYASWKVDNENLKKGLTQADNDANEHKSFNPSQYVSQIMRTIGVEKPGSESYPSNSPDLKNIVNNQIFPKPDYTY